MVELGELEAHERQFAAKHVRVVAISNDDLETARITQADFPHLVVVSDADQNIAKAMDVIHKGAGRDGSDTNAPTTFLIDGKPRHALHPLHRAPRSACPLGIPHLEG
jgi:peroxiredoxin